MAGRHGGLRARFQPISGHDFADISVGFAEHRLFFHYEDIVARHGYGKNNTATYNAEHQTDK